MSVARRLCRGQSCDLHPTSATKRSSLLGYNHWGGISPLHHPYTLACTLIDTRQHRLFSFLLRRHPHQSSTRPHTRHAQLTHLQKSSDSTHSITFKSSDSNYYFPFKNSDSIHASGLLALVSSDPRAFPPSRVPWFDTT